VSSPRVLSKNHVPRPCLSPAVVRSRSGHVTLGEMTATITLPSTRGHNCRVTALVSVYRSMASWPISRPQPDCLYPPKGSEASKTL